MKFDNLKDAQGTRDERQVKLAEIYEQAGPDLDMSKVTSIEGDTTAKVAKMAELNAEMSDIMADIKALTDLAKNREDFLALERGKKGVVRTSGDIDTSGDEGGHAVKSLGEMFTESETYKQYVGENSGGGSMPKSEKSCIIGKEFGVKTLMSTTAGWAPETTRTGLVVPEATRPIQVMDIIPMGNTGQAAVVYMEETTFTNNAAEVAEAGQYAEAALALTERTSTVRKIAVFLPVTDEQLEDEAQVSSYINQRLPFMIRQRLDSQIINGDGIAPNLTGILTTAGIQTQAQGADTNEDAFYKAMVLIQNTGQAIPSHHIVNPVNWQTIRLRKTVDGVYIFGDPSQVGVVTLWGLPVVEAQAAPLNTGITGDYNNFIQLTERRGIEVKISDSHSDYFIKGKQAIRADMRVALPVYRPAAFCQITGLD